MFLLIGCVIILFRRILITLNLSVLVTHLHRLNIHDPGIKYA